MTVVGRDFRCPADWRHAKGGGGVGFAEGCGGRGATALPAREGRRLAGRKGTA